MNLTVFLGLFIIGCFALAVLWLEGALKSNAYLVVAVVFVAAAMLLRGFCMDHETADYQTFLAKWVQYFRDNGGFAALSGSVGNYNLPYLYFLAVFSYSGISDLYLIKFLSVFFDVILAWGVMRLVYVYSRSAKRVMAAFLITLFLPTVVLNGAYWGQCDSIYAAFAVWSIYFALDNKPVRAMVMSALSFAFKLQAVFILPVFLVFIFAKKMKWWQLGIFPLTYFITVLPAVLLGRPLVDTVTLYFNQAGSIGGGLNYNSSSVFALIKGSENTGTLSALGIAAAFLFVIAVFAYTYRRRKRLSDFSLLVCTVLFAVSVPFLLPHMHDRYFFMADVFSLTLAVTAVEFSALPVLVSFASLLGYHAYLKMKYLLPMRYGSYALLICVFILVFSLVFELSKNRKKSS